MSQLALPRRRMPGLPRFGAVGAVTVTASVVCGLFALVAIFAPLLAPHDPYALDALNAFASPSASHLLGTDDTGRDLLSRLIYGARPSLAGPALVIVLASTAGTVLAMLAAWFGGWIDAIVSRIAESLYAVPGLVLGVVAAAVFGSGFFAPVIALSIAYLPVILRVMRTAALRERNLPYIDALRMQGMGGMRICLRHLLPNILPLLLAQSAVGFGYAMIDLATISFLGLGIQPPAADWGVMVAAGKASILNGQPEQSLYAALVVMVAIVAFNLVGERIAQRLEERDSR
ncbi:peptide/nickel transport system permease protein [Kibdelosporangium banguiense]|uniref:Peptide/nickel transport system permease protein n=1 Tax=Kibdelosporangium banguiense TaxID=1365924 RepID=A0ABS4TZ69_9PSEU|nr:ABC transporter permease [Kibdelosporangium banguiense]MBP2329201.1 peptide/nickel transport system permease protein [Kibdelosporangium banguiense]